MHDSFPSDQGHLRYEGRLRQVLLVDQLDQPPDHFRSAMRYTVVFEAAKAVCGVNNVFT